MSKDMQYGLWCGFVWGFTAGIVLIGILWGVRG